MSQDTGPSYNREVEQVEEYAWPSVDWLDYSSLKEEITQLNAGPRIEWVSGECEPVVHLAITPRLP